MGRYRHLRRGGQIIPEHVYVWEKFYGVKVPKGYIVHHLDCKGRNNDPENLVIMTQSDHKTVHAILHKIGMDTVLDNDPEVIKDREACKKYAVEHKEHIASYKKRYYEENRDAIREHQARYAEAHREEAKARAKKYYYDNLEHVREYKRENRDLIRAQKRLRSAKIKNLPADEIKKFENQVLIEKRKKYGEGCTDDSFQRRHYKSRRSY